MLICISLNFFLFYFILWFVTSNQKLVSSLLSKYDDTKNAQEFNKKITFAERLHFLLRFPQYTFKLYKIKNKLFWIWCEWVTIYSEDKPLENLLEVYYMGRGHKCFWREINRGWYDFNNVTYATITGNPIKMYNH